MNVETRLDAESTTETTHYDVLIVGAGISGIEAGEFWWDLVCSPISRHPVGQRSVHLRL